jgi:signal transduction histidine kinase
VLALALGVLIPRIVERHALGSELDAAVALVRILEQGDFVPPIDDHLAGKAYRRLNAVVQGGLLGGENLRVKLWNRDGEIVYSDARGLIGLRFPIGPGLEHALGGSPSASFTDLSLEENRLDRALGDRVLELYIPLRGPGGDVVGAFEVYQDSRHIESHMVAVRRAVWLAVGSGLGILLLFLILLFGTTAATIEAELEARQQLRTRLVHAQEEERRRVVGSFHHDAGQALTRILYGIRGSRARLGAADTAVAEELTRLEALVDGLIVDLRRLMGAARPTPVGGFALPEALEAYARDLERESGIPVELRLEPILRLDPVTGITLFRAAQEALVNAWKHAEADGMRVSLARTDGIVELTVEDDGRGAADIRDGIGLADMRDRVGALGGHVEVVSTPGAGTRVVVRTPMGADDAAYSDPRR